QLARDFRRGPGPSDGGEELRLGSRALFRLRLRLGSRAPDDAAPWHRGPAAFLRRRPSLPRAVPMNIPERWLRSFCNPPLTGAELAERLTMAGVEVEAYEPVGPQFSGVVVAQIVEVARHPNADKLTVCTVDVGGAKLRVVCGAPNVRAGMKAPLAKIGARLPGAEIGRSTLRGVESEGMLCSARELGLSE